MSQVKFGSRCRIPALSAGVLVALLGLVVGLARPTQAALVDGGNGAQLVIGLDDDNQANTEIQSGVANQSLSRTDILDGGRGNDVMLPGTSTWCGSAPPRRGTSLSPCG